MFILCKNYAADRHRAFRNCVMIAERERERERERVRENEKARENESHVRNINVMSYKNGNYANYTRKYWNISQSSSGVLGVATNVSKKKKKKKKKKK